MATFKVGQRVRVLATKRHSWTDEGTVMGIGHWNPSGERGWYVKCDNHRSSHWTGEWNVDESHLRPLTDPKADAFLESIRQLKPLNVSEVA